VVVCVRVRVHVYVPRTCGSVSFALERTGFECTRNIWGALASIPTKSVSMLRTLLAASHAMLACLIPHPGRAFVEHISGTRACAVHPQILLFVSGKGIAAARALLEAPHDVPSLSVPLRKEVRMYYKVRCACIERCCPHVLRGEVHMYLGLCHIRFLGWRTPYI
jgi:hypothetical protein